MPIQIVVAGALISRRTLLMAQRPRPPELAGLWELPGGKVAPGESDAAALARELHEELGVEIAVGARVGADVALSETMTLHALPGHPDRRGAASQRSPRTAVGGDRRAGEPAVGARRPGMAG